MEHRKPFNVGNLPRVDFIQLPNPFQFVAGTFVQYNDRIGLFVSDRKGFGVMLQSPESLRSMAGLCFVPGSIHANAGMAFDRVHLMLQHQGVTLPDEPINIEQSFIPLASMSEDTKISVDSVLHDGHIAIRIGVIGVQSLFVLDGCETAIACVPIDRCVNKEQWATTFNNLSSTWDALTPR